MVEAAHCGECGAAYAGAAPKCGGEKGQGKKAKDVPVADGAAGQSSSASRRKPAEGFKHATAAVLELLPLDGRLRPFLRLIENEKDRDSLVAAAAMCPGLEEAAAAVAEIRWPATTPDKEAQRDLARAQQEERTAEKAFGDAQAVTAKARAALAEAEAAEATSLAAREAAVAKAAEASARYSSLENKGVVPAADAAMLPPDATVAVEATMGKVRQLVASNEAAARKYAEQFELQTSKGLGKGKGSEARADAAPYTASDDSGEASSLAGWVQGGAGKDLQVLRDSSARNAAGLKEILATMETAQLTLNTCLAKVSEIAGADKEL